jgi:hypothetical protein
MIRTSPPHAVLISGPGSSGKTTLALDLAAGLLCRDPDPEARPCRMCRGCRLVESGNHPDLHRLAPEGPGGQVRIGSASDPDPGTVRHLIGELSLLSAEGGARVAIVEAAHRLNDDAQNALLKLLEEPPAGVTIVLCADDEECLLPTVRSRCARVRVGAAAGREIEAWLGELGVADAPTAARLARISGGRPGLALAYARSVDAVRLRGELARRLIDLLDVGRQPRLEAIRELLKSAAGLDAALAEVRGAGSTVSEERPRRRTARGRAATASLAAAALLGPDAVDGSGASPVEDPDAGASPAPGATAKPAAAARRSAAGTLIELWAAVARDLAVTRLGGGRGVREIDLVDDLRACAPRVDPASLGSFLERLAWVDQQLEANVNPELAMDVLVLTWPRLLPDPAAQAKGGAGGPFRTGGASR